jgi:tetratricopeptide (TPR) repeat protein
MKKWSIPTSKLIGPRKLGGRVTRRGFAFQDAYACLQLTRLLDDMQGVIAIRPEGAQDVDLLYTDGREEYIQLKHEPNEHYTLVALRSILQGFAVDFLEASRASTLAFALIARSNYIDAAVTRLRDGKPSSGDITNVARLFAQSIKGSPAPQCLVRLSEAERLDLAVQLLRQTKFSFGMGDEIGGRLSFESHTCTELAKSGIAGTELQDAFNTLKAALDMQREFTRIDIEELLKRFIGGASINLFEGCVEALTDELLSHPASPNRIQQFYAGAPLDWDIIAAHGDIERDQQEDLIKQLSQPSETLKLVCVVAEPGAGKSTLAWRVAAELHQRHSVFIIRIRNKEDAGAWYLMSDFCQKVKRPFYVLADDLFHEPDVVSALRELNPSLSITILATSRAHEYRPYRLKGQVERVSLTEPSLSEKERILTRLGKTRNDLTPEQQRRLDAANQFLVLMMELTDPKGRKLEEIVRDTIEWLQTHDDSAYRAYEYLCFAYQHSLSISTSLLERLDVQGRFHNLPERDTAQGLIFNDEGHTGNMRVGHPVIAKTASVFYEEEHRAPAMVLSEIVAAVDTSNHLERRFVVHLLRVLAQAKSSALHSAFSRIEADMALCKQKATINELSIWRAFYLNLGQHERAEECVDAALARAPVISGDCNTLLKLCRERARERDALPAIAKWVYEHPELHGDRPAYLSLVERYGTRNEVEEVLKETSAWLGAHLKDTYVRTAYLGLVERQGTSEQVERVLQETSAWLGEHSGDTSVRTAYLGLVERQGTAEQVERVLQETSAWLAQHPKNIDLRAALIGLIERKGSDRLKKAMIYDTRVWLSEHTAVKEVWRSLIAALIRLHRQQEAVETAMEAISHHPDDPNLVTLYLQFVHELADEQAVRGLFKSLITRYRGNRHFQIEFAAWLRDNNHPDEAEAYYKEQIELPQSKATRLLRQMAYYGYGQLLLKLERYGEAEEQFRLTLRIRRGHQMAHDGLAQALHHLGSITEQEGRVADADRCFLKAEQEFRQAIYWAGVREQPQAIFYTHLGWFYIDRKQYTDALEAFYSAMEEAPEFFGNYWGLGRALMGLGRFQPAASALRMALEKAPEDFQPPASDEIPELLQQCQDALNYSDDIAKDV